MCSAAYDHFLYRIIIIISSVFMCVFLAKKVFMCVLASTIGRNGTPSVFNYKLF